jgi:hypothetical protein
MVNQLSLDSYDKLHAGELVLSAAYIKILKALHKYPKQLDLKRIAKVTGLTINNVCGRMGKNELRNKEYPLVIGSGKKYCTTTHRNVMTYMINPEYEYKVMEVIK